MLEWDKISIMGISITFVCLTIRAELNALVLGNKNVFGPFKV